MKKGITIIMLFLAFTLTALARVEGDTLWTGRMVEFVENQGQLDSRVRFEAQLHDGALFLEEEGVMVALRERNGSR